VVLQQSRGSPSNGKGGSWRSGAMAGRSHMEALQGWSCIDQGEKWGERAVPTHVTTCNPAKGSGSQKGDAGKSSPVKGKRRRFGNGGKGRRLRILLLSDPQRSRKRRGVTGTTRIPPFRETLRSLPFNQRRLQVSGRKRLGKRRGEVLERGCCIICRVRIRQFS